MHAVRVPEQVTPGSVFVAAGRHREPAAVRRALQAGARWALAEDPHLVAAAAGGARGRVRVVADARRAYALLSAAGHGMPGFHLTAAGVTGTNGKTTVATMLQWVLNACGRPCGLVGTVSVDTGRRRLAAGLTTPDAADLAAHLAEMRQAGLTHVVMEASSHGIEQRRTDGVRFQAAVFTNFSVDHLDYHGSTDRYFAAKSRLFERLRPQAWAVLNADDPRREILAARTRARVLTFGGSPGADVRGEPLDARRVRVAAGGFRAEGEIPGLGAHRTENALATLAAAFALGVPPDGAWAAIARFPGVWRRLQAIEGAPGWVVDDCAHNPGNLSAAVGAMRELRPARLWVVYAVRGNRGVAINRANAAALAGALRTFDHRLLLTEAEDLAGPGDRVSPEETLAYTDTFARLGQPYDFHPLAESALSHALLERDPGDVVLLLGAHAMDGAADLWRRLSQRGPDRPAAAPLHGWN